MPPRTRTRATKVLKENIEIVKKNGLKSNGKVTKPPRKPLADKTNSLSDDNESIDIAVKSSKTTLKNNAPITKTDNNVRPRRDRRLPPRYVENQVLKNLSNSKESPVKQNNEISKTETENKKPNNPSSVEALSKVTKIKSKINTHEMKAKIPTKASKVEKSSEPDKIRKNGAVSINNPSSLEKIATATRPRRNCRLQSEKEKVDPKDSSSLNGSSPFKSPSNDLECSLVANRPKRISRLPSKFEDHSISPNKFIPVQPCFASTPIIQKNRKINKSVENGKENENIIAKNKVKDKHVDKPIPRVIQKSKPTKTVVKSSFSDSSVDKSSPDTNNNGKNKIVRPKRTNQVKTVSTKLQTKQVSPKTNKIKPFAKRLLEKSLSFRILDDKKQSKGGNLDVYEFTFDPNEEPPPQKKKRKRTIKKKPAKPKMVELKSNYNDNVSKAITNLKNKIKPSQSQPQQNNLKPTDNVKSTDNIKPTNHVKPAATENTQNTQAVAETVTNNIPQINTYSIDGTSMPPINESARSIHESNYASIRIEDIAADFESSDHHDDINYSPVNSPHQPQPTEPPEINEDVNQVFNKDPLNLQGDISFFDEHPVASSSMNVSGQHPLAMPWRVEFGSLPMKWHSNTYVKPNMTPAVESSFINSEDTSKKHVYTNMVPENEPLPEIVEAPNLKQTSIISFMREAAEKCANKKKRRRSPLPTKTNSIFEDVTIVSDEFGYNTPKKAKKTKDTTPNISSGSEKSNNKENSNQSIIKSSSPTKEQKKKDKDCTYFGFDESENVDQENVSLVKRIPNKRTRGLRSRAVLQDFNAPVGPTRAVMPVAAKAKLPSSEVVEQLFEQLVSAEDASQCPEKETAKEPADETMVADADDPSWKEDDNSQSVHLFEDIDVVHNVKAHYKSYGKAKKVTIRQPSFSGSDTEPRAIERPHSSDDDLADLSFHLPTVKQKKTIKKKKPKKQLTKKEEKEVEEWAAGFNSMCEDIDEFPLVVE